eukprot:3777772-Prymnesium_polylepis.1
MGVPVLPSPSCGQSPQALGARCGARVWEETIGPRAKEGVTGHLGDQTSKYRRTPDPDPRRRRA